MTDEAKSLIIRMAWEDRTTFEEIREKTGFSEREVIQLMRKSLKPGSFRRWRKRVSGRVTKHAVKFRENRKRLKRVSGLRLLNAEE